jgi:3-deoxy-D-manno-octulosonic-acid transferase
VGLLYDVLVPLAALAAAPAWLMRSIRHPEYRAHLPERFGRLPDTLVQRLGALPRRPVWMQAVSVGEVGVARTLLEALQEPIPVLVSSTTPAGREAAASLPAGRVVGTCHFPIDWSPCVRRALDAIRPAAFVSVETEIWPGLMSACLRRAVPVAIVNGRISERSHGRYRRVRGLLRESLRGVRLACMQTGDDAERAVSIGIDPSRVVVTGNVKFDAPADSSSQADLKAVYDLPAAGGPPVMVAGSTSPGEEEIVLEAMREMREGGLRDLLVILAPRHRERFEEVATLLRSRGVPFARRSRMPAERRQEAPVVLLDTIGELARVYDLAAVAFVGGSLVRRGGQNMIEPAARGVPVLFGPHTWNFESVAAALLACGAGTRVHHAKDLAREAARLISDDGRRTRAAEAGRALIAAHRGATGRTLAHLLPVVRG